MTELEKTLQQEYENFIKTDVGQQWKKKWQEWYNNDKDTAGDFADYLYDFHSEMLLMMFRSCARDNNKIIKETKE